MASILTCRKCGAWDYHDVVKESPTGQQRSKYRCRTCKAEYWRAWNLPRPKLEVDPDA